MSDGRPVTLREITDENREAVVALAVAPGQEKFVASVKASFVDAETYPEAHPWYRAIYAADEPVGFVMISWNVTPVEDILGPWFLWRLLIGADHQRQGYGRAALAEIGRIVRAEGGTALLTSYTQGDGEPWPFYQRLGFIPTGEIHDDEVVLRLELARP